MQVASRAVSSALVLRWYRLAVLFTTVLVANCSISTSENLQKNTLKDNYTGRMSMVVQSEPVQSFSGSFELQGSVGQGTLSLFTPLGSTAALLRWSPGLAQLQTGATVQDYPSVQAMMERTTGAAVPIAALFAWLGGDQVAVPGWQADMSRYADGRIVAVRTDPAPSVQLRIALDR
jgi:outer membrane lipoprotein LolB